MFDFNLMEHVKTLLDNGMEMGDGEILFWKNEFGYQFEFWKNSSKNHIGGLGKKIEESDWETFKKKVVDYFLGVEDK
ncbi:MAG: hypothetical protein ACRDAG_01215 [Cetobacterium somerae]|uniref:hypothetical protein n=1 Tax=Cetobacterium somerae TaxID=188913 RepID=UPI003F2E78B6